MSVYHKKFFQEIKTGSLQSAKEIVPIIIDLINPKSVVDLGCGTGSWLSVFKTYGLNDFLGIDGEYVDKKNLQIPEENFFSHNLAQPLILKRKFDLVISLEVAEHLPPKSAEVFIDSLVSLSPVVIFSAAIPHQGGLNHQNEQWPEYWIKLFKKKGYSVFDCIRSKVWDNKNVEWWYAQNIFVFVKNEKIDNYSNLENNTGPLAIVHPKKYLDSINNRSIKEILKLIIKKIKYLFNFVNRSR